MSNDYNYFCLIGRLTKDAEIKYTTSGTPVINFSIASNKKTKSNEYCNFFNIEMWGNIATALINYLKKGTMVQVAGEVKQERWQDKTSGQSREKIKFIAYNIQLLGSNKQQDNQYQFDDPFRTGDQK